MIVNIFKGFWNWLFNSEEKLSEKRMSICNECEHKDVNVCNVCGCVLEWKTRVKEETCPHPKGAKW